MARRDWLLRVKTVGSLVLLLTPVLAVLAVVWVLTAFYGLMVVYFIGIPVAWVAKRLIPGLVAGISIPDSVVRQSGTLVGLCATGYVVMRLYRARHRSSQALLDEFITAPASRQAQPTLCEVVPAVCQRLDQPEPDVVVAGPDAPAALTIGVKPEESTLLVSARTLEELNPAEVEAVVAHELAHLKNRDSALKTLLLSPNAALMGVTMAYVFPLLPVLVVYWLLVEVSGGTYARVREQVADRTAARVTGNPAALANALETLDDHTADRPAEDARRQAVAALSIVPDPAEFHYGAERDIKPVVWPVQKPIRKAWMRLTAKHPRTERRVDALRRVERGQERV